MDLFNAVFIPMLGLLFLIGLACTPIAVWADLHRGEQSVLRKLGLLTLVRLRSHRIQRLAVLRKKHEHTLVSLNGTKTVLENERAARIDWTPDLQALQDRHDHLRKTLRSLELDIAGLEALLGESAKLAPDVDKRSALKFVRVRIADMRLEEDALEQEILNEAPGHGPHRKAAKVPTD